MSARAPRSGRASRTARAAGAHVFAVALLAVAPFGACTKQAPIPLPDAAATPDGGADAEAVPEPRVETCRAAGESLGRACVADAECDDGCFCDGQERCAAGVCAAGEPPCVDAIECTADACVEERDRCIFDPRHERCGDGDACNGVERCAPGRGCLPGAPLYCNDEDPCTFDRCDASEGCVFAVRDLDGDGFSDLRCGGDDCDDDPRFGGATFPGAPEDCTNRRDDDCDGARDFSDRDCVPTNDTCASAVRLPGPGSFGGSTVGLAPDGLVGCGLAGPDAVFRFELAEPMDVLVRLAGAGEGAALAVRDFASCREGPDQRCATGSAPELLLHSAPAGEYALIVSTVAGTPFELILALGPATPTPRVDRCEAETDALCPGGLCDELLDVSFAGAFSDVADDYRLTCAGGVDAPDAAYRFRIDTPRDVRFELRTRDASFEYGGRLALSQGCADLGAERACASGAPAVLRRRSLAPGEYFVLLESAAAEPRTWELVARIEEPAARNAGDACSSALDLDEPSLGAGASETVAVSSLEFDTGAGCGGAASSHVDASFRFSLPTTRDVTITTRGAGRVHHAELTTACGDSSTALRCWTGADTVTETWRSLPMGDYFVTVAASGGSGDVTATLRTAPPTPLPPNDRCSGAIELVDGLRRSDTTEGFADDAIGGACAAGARADAFYRLTLMEETTVIVSADARGVPLALSLRSGCGAVSDDLACAEGSPATLHRTLAAGDYVLLVESPPGVAADFDLFASLFPSP